MDFKNIFERYALQVNNCICPGIPENKVVVFVDGEQYNSSGEPDIEKFINSELAPWALVNGIECNNMHHGSFVTNRDYDVPSQVINNESEDYDVDTTVLNFIFAVMAAADQHITKKQKGITLIGYWGEAGISTVSTFKTEEEFAEYVKDDLEYFEEE